MAEKQPSPTKATDQESQKDDDLIVHDSTKEPEVSDDDQVEQAKQMAAEAGDDVTPATDNSAKPTLAGDKPKRKFIWTRKKIIIASVAAVVVLLATLFAIPVTRYGILGVFVKHSVTFVVKDAETDQPVSNVALDIAGQSTTTDAEGVATISAVPVGNKHVTAQKKNYNEIQQDVLIPLTGGDPSFDFSMQAIGRQVSVKIINKISQQPVEGADISADGTSSKTDKNGEATLVLPADQQTVQAIITSNGYNETAVEVTVTEQQDDKNTFSIVPSGQVYFLSKRSGTIDVMKSDLDGSNAAVVLAGTGSEDEFKTTLSASPDWKYLILQARRDSDKAKIYVIDTATGTLKNVDEGNASFDLYSWADSDRFVYRVNREDVNNDQDKKFALKVYNARTGQLSVLDESKAYYYQGDVNVLGDTVVYTSSPQYNAPADSKQAAMSVRADGAQKQTLKEFDQALGVAAERVKPDTVYYQATTYASGGNTYAFYQFSNGQFTNIDFKHEEFAKYYPTYLESPSGNSTFWYEPRDGKNTLFVGNANGNDGQQIVELSEFTPYGWFGEDYLLVSKKGSELYILSRSNPSQQLKVTDYHRPQYGYYGYGGVY